MRGKNPQFSMQYLGELIRGNSIASLKAMIERIDTMLGANGSLS